MLTKEDDNFFFFIDDKSTGTTCKRKGATSVSTDFYCSSCHVCFVKLPL